MIQYFKTPFGKCGSGTSFRLNHQIFHMQGTSPGNLVLPTQIILATYPIQGGSSSLVFLSWPSPNLDWVSDADRVLTRRWSPLRTVNDGGRFALTAGRSAPLGK